MKKIGSILLMFSLLLTVRGWSPVFAQADPTVWATVHFNKKEVVTGEPLLVTVTVYTSTWFTSPPQFGEIQVPEAIMVEYQQRSGAMRKTVGRKSYPAIEKKFLVYPFRVGENTLPEMRVVVESPDEGDYKGKRRVIRTAPTGFRVRPWPEGVDPASSLTSFGVTVSEQWSLPLENLQQGDVLERILTVRASGALAALIPPLEIPAPGFGNVYAQQAGLSNVQNQASMTGTRTERWTYLLEQEGSYTIPGIVISWYDPASGRVASTGTDPHRIRIAANPDLDFLLTMQDSLRMMLEDAGSEEGEAYSWLGLNWWQLGLALALLLVSLFPVYRFAVFILLELGIRRERRLMSEAKQFTLLGESTREKDPLSFYNQLMVWYQRFSEENLISREGLPAFLAQSGNRELEEGYRVLNNLLFSEKGDSGWSGDAFFASLSRYRRKWLRSGSVERNLGRTNINPT
jgi:hypothetical protein